MTILSISSTCQPLCLSLAAAVRSIVSESGPYWYWTQASAGQGAAEMQCLTGALLVILWWAWV